MPPKTETQVEIKPDQKKGTVICGHRSPGPKYQLKTLVGYQKHCISRYREPAYTIGKRIGGLTACEGPGPKYLLVTPKQPAFTFGIRGKIFDISCGPGPKYILPAPKTPAFSIRGRIEEKQGCRTPGPYYLKSPPQGPAFSIGCRTAGLKCDGGPGPRAYSVKLTKPSSPVCSLAYRYGGKLICHSPGPKYHPKLPKPTPIYSFGVKHSECAPPYIVECDDQC